MCLVPFHSGPASSASRKKEVFHENRSEPEMYSPLLPPPTTHHHFLPDSLGKWGMNTQYEATLSDLPLAIVASIKGNIGGRNALERKATKSAKRGGECGEGFFVLWRSVSLLLATSFRSFLLLLDFWEFRLPVLLFCLLSRLVDSNFTR